MKTKSGQLKKYKWLIPSNYNWQLVDMLSIKFFSYRGRGRVVPFGCRRRARDLIINFLKIPFFSGKALSAKFSGLPLYKNTN